MLRIEVENYSNSHNYLQMGQVLFRMNEFVDLIYYMIKSNTIAYILEEKALSKN